MLGISGKFGLSLNMLVFDGSVKAICTSIFWGPLKILNSNLIVLLINFIISQNGVYCAKKFIVVGPISFI